MIYTDDEGKLVRRQEIGNISEFDEKVKENNNKFCSFYLKDMEHMVNQFSYSRNPELPMMISKKMMNDSNL